ncbi:murein L,D-transpeptidase family protein [Rhizobium sp. SSA_523]|uniref:L,D-transpeptidase family protein n=1 Tax=Rhizobium sp. SSA_523 TaxID=2952477 RepID=UPI00209001DA|nr:murein L,D-transpeptidase family protein [Rhizobium sp. SSA_523]MCO5733645.1 murein L,D-transpeptidase [Rhizobium sp. SSA_523]WKC23060.1 murein L,D-transpeptidase family protein [Rhizobium sp. SSA_523]
MRLRHIATLLLMATALAGCNDTIDGAIDVSKVKNKVEQPLPSRIVAEMQKKNMPRNSPIMIRVFKEEGKMEIWKAKADNRFDKIADYDICAWSGKLGPKVKEGDRQAPEGFYNLTPAHLNPNSKYYLAINTGFPNRYDAANGRSGSNLMIHGACSSSGCYSMTDAQILEIYAFARDAFRGGQTAVQLQAFPFRMTAENMARHRTSENLEFWKMLKVGYDNFEVTKRPPEVNVCGRKYVFNQEFQGAAGLSPAAACPPMASPPALASALSAYEKQYELAYAKAVDKLDGKLWYEPTEAERKAIVAEKRKGRDLAYAPTGTSLAAGKLVAPAEFEKLMSARLGKPAPAPAQILTASTSTEPSVEKQGRLEASASLPGKRTAASVQEAMTAPATTATAATTTTTPTTTTGSIPVPGRNPLAYTVEPQPVQSQSVSQNTDRKPFWKLW